MLKCEREGEWGKRRKDWDGAMLALLDDFLLGVLLFSNQVYARAMSTSLNVAICTQKRPGQRQTWESHIMD